MRDALASWHIGRVIYAWRTHPMHETTISQLDVANWLDVAQATLSRIETGDAPEALSKLVKWATLLHIPEELLWFQLPRMDAAAEVDRRQLLILATSAVAAATADDLLPRRSPGQSSLSVPANAVEADEFDASVPDIETAFWAAGNVEHDGPVREIAELVALGRRITKLQMACDYATLGPQLAPLITELYRQAHSGRSADRSLAWDALAQVASETSVAMRARGYLAVAWSAALAAESAARRIDSRQGIASGAYVRSQVLLARPKSLKEALDCAVRAATFVGPDATTAPEIQTVGMLHLQAALVTATMGGNPHDHLGQAAEYAARLDRSVADDPTTIVGNVSFGSANVALWNMTVAMEHSPERVLDLARRLNPRSLPTVGRAAQYFVEVGRAAAARDDHVMSLEALLRAEHIAPHEVRKMSTVHELVGDMMVKAGRELITGDLGKLASRVGAVPR
ncbi:helix-turn-helix domain-containing protein [Nocardia salmonicida]|uniref:helix-turn-helix domain-containing protein n=1 Tax=Nocardia salmonicida TaxID=53431 RepID=UPI0007A3E285|nr:helix-turn-helix transcriptional regulator [Nocardia salmonicida]